MRTRETFSLEHPLKGRIGIFSKNLMLNVTGPLALSLSPKRISLRQNTIGQRYYHTDTRVSPSGALHTSSSRAMASRGRCRMPNCRPMSSGSSNSLRSWSFSTNSLMPASNFTVPIIPAFRPSCARHRARHYRRRPSTAAGHDGSAVSGISRHRFEFFGSTGRRRDPAH
jgi:hypothetical protein